MKLIVVRLLNVLVAGLVAGSVFVIWLGYPPQSLSSIAYIEQQQVVIRTLNTIMPLLGLLTIVLTLASALLQRSNKGIFLSLCLAIVFFLVAGLTTRFGNQPINAVVMTWNPEIAPQNWMELRDQWWSYHILRTIASVVGFILVTWSSIRKE